MFFTPSRIVAKPTKSRGVDATPGVKNMGLLGCFITEVAQQRGLAKSHCLGQQHVLPSHSRWSGLPSVPFFAVWAQVNEDRGDRLYSPNGGRIRQSSASYIQIHMLA